MKTKNKLTTALGGRDATVSNNNEVFAKQKLQRIILTWMSILFAVTISLMATACKDGDEEEPTVRSSGTEKPLTFGTGCKVTIKSDDKFTDDDWNKTCDKVVSAIMRGYNKDMGVFDTPHKGTFTIVFASTNNATVILSNSAAYNCEVKTGNENTVYLKTSAIGTVDIQPAVVVMHDNIFGENDSYQN